MGEASSGSDGGGRGGGGEGLFWWARSACVCVCVCGQVCVCVWPGVCVCGQVVVVVVMVVVVVVVVRGWASSGGQEVPSGFLSDLQNDDRLLVHARQQVALCQRILEKESLHEIVKATKGRRGFGVKLCHHGGHYNDGSVSEYCRCTELCVTRVC